MTPAIFVVASIAAPFVLLRAHLLRLWFAMYGCAWIVFLLLAGLARALRVDVDPRIAFVVFGLAVVASLFFVVARNGEGIRWSANRAAVVAAIFYVVVIALMMRTPIDGDEPYYLLMTESMVHDRDLDLSNQYRDLAHSATGRTDLVPQIGDAGGPHGAQYSRLEPFLALLMVPGYLAGRLPGALAIIALFGVLLARSTIRLFEDEGIDDATIRALFPLIAFAPPIVFYAARSWPEVPAAFCFVEAVRGVRQRRASRWLPALSAMVLLKFRFLLVAVVLLARALRNWKHIAIAIGIVAIVVAVGSATSAHTWSELVPGPPLAMLRGFFGLLLDGAAGILFQAPIYAFGVLAAARWRSAPGAFRLGISSSALYLLYLVPRAEWHGGWSPPLRYIVFLMPILALGIASTWQRIAAAPLMIGIAWTFGVTAHGLAYPWRLFHIENGENRVGETLSTIWHSDFSRLFPSFIRPNFAAIVASILAVIVFFLCRAAAPGGRPAGTPLLYIVPILIALAFVFGRRPGDRVEFEDAHVIHRGGELYPAEFQVQRFAYRGGWILHQGQSMSFLARGGPAMLQYSTGIPSMIQVGRDAYPLPPTRGYGSVRVNVRQSGRVELRCLQGAVNLDRMDHE